MSGEGPQPAGPEQEAVLALLRPDEPLAPMTTIGTGGPARFFARVGSRAELPLLLAWAQRAGEPVAVLGSGSNLLVADEGVAGLVIKLDRELAAISTEAERLLCGAGARLPAVAARAAREGLSGIEFGVNIPGTVGGAVRMNANAYGGELAAVLEWVEIAGPDGYERRLPQAARLRLPQLGAARGRGRRRRCHAPAPSGRGAGQGHPAGAAPPPPRGPAAGDQDVRVHLQEPS